MQAIVFIGIQACDKSTFYHHQFGLTHVRINLDMLKTRYREQRVFGTCLEFTIMATAWCLLLLGNVHEGRFQSHCEPASIDRTAAD
jgi:hypothetical protein